VIYLLPERAGEDEGQAECHVEKKVRNDEDHDNNVKCAPVITSEKYGLNLVKKDTLDGEHSGAIQDLCDILILFRVLSACQTPDGHCEAWGLETHVEGTVELGYRDIPLG
jgi:hypothetical protein